MWVKCDWDWPACREAPQVTRSRRESHRRRGDVAATALVLLFLVALAFAVLAVPGPLE